MNRLSLWASSIFVSMLVMGVAAPVVFAQTTTASTSIQAKLDLINSLEQQIQSLNQQMLGLQQQQQSIAVSLVSSLSLGAQGDQVKVLQALLAADPNIYPEGLITGYFGPLTKQAVERYQKANGIEQVGRVGPETRAKLNEDLLVNPISFENSSSTPGMATSTEGNGNEGDMGNHLCAIVPPGHLIAPGWLRKHGGDIPIIPSCQILPPGIEGQLNESSTVPSPAFSVSDVGTSVSSSTATISWATNGAATGKVFYGTANPLDIASSSTLFVNAPTLATSQIVQLTGLDATTTYFFVVQATDASANTTTTAQASFTTGQ